MQLVRQAVTSGDWSRLSGTIYKALAEELWVLGQLVLRGNRIIMPESLWKHTIALAHEGHQGMTRMSQGKGMVAQHGQASRAVYKSLSSLPASWPKK